MYPLPALGQNKKNVHVERENPVFKYLYQIIKRKGQKIKLDVS